VSDESSDNGGESAAFEGGFSSFDSEMEITGSALGDPRIMAAPPVVRRMLACLLQARTAADALPSLMYTMVTNGKAASLGFLAANLIFLLTWLPFWVLSFAVGEWGVYLLAIVTIFSGGRAFIRMIAFPGANSRVAAEIEVEFSRYSVRMIVAASQHLIEVASALASSDSAGSARRSPDLPGLWRHAMSYRDRVLGVYLDVLLHLFRHPVSPTHPTDPGLTKYGNNRLSGDLGNLSGLTVRVRSQSLYSTSNCLPIFHLMDHLFPMFLASSSCRRTGLAGSIVDDSAPIR
jgi:hypothetical protein